MVMKLPFRRALALVVLVGLAQGARAADSPYQDLLRRLPDSTKLLAAGSPANRQMLKRWLAYQKNNQLAALSSYLLQAAAPADAAVLVMAVDLADSLDPAAVHRGLNGSKVMASRKNADYEKVAK